MAEETTKKDYETPITDHEEGLTEGSIVSVIDTAEINQQIATAHRFPRSITNFRRRVYEMVTIDVDTAESCIYAVPRDGKMIDGPSIRFAEIILVGWGNHRSSAEVTDIGEEFVTASGVFFDLETNGAIQAKIMRRIVGKPTAQNPKGKRYGVDGIANTGNAACSIALRNAILRGVPKALWKDLFDEAKRVAGGTAQTFATRRDKVIKELGIQGATPEQIYALLGLKGLEDMQTEHIVHLRGLQNAIKDGETTVDEAFSVDAAHPPGSVIPPRPKQSDFERKSPEKKTPVEVAKAEPESKPAETGNTGAQSEAVTQTAVEDKKATNDAFFENWFTEKKAELETVKTVRGIGPLNDEVIAEIEEDEVRLAEWQPLVTARLAAIKAMRQK